MADNRPIGVFDSGIGGLTVLREIWDTVPDESTVYFGDNGRTPYGTKSRSTIRKYCLQNMEFLRSKDVKMIVIACNTASAYAYKDLAKNADVPVIEVVTPGAMEAAKTTRNGKIGIIATPASVNSGVYKSAVEQKAIELISKGENKEALLNLEIYQKACPLFVSLAEEGWWDKEVTRLTAIEYLTPLKEAGIDTLVLGCTHYPLLTKVIGEVMGPDVKLVNTGKAVAVEVKKVLSGTGNLSENNSSQKEFYTSDDPKMFENVASPFLGCGLPAGTRHFNTDRYDVEGML